MYFHEALQLPILLNTLLTFLTLSPFDGLYRKRTAKVLNVSCLLCLVCLTRCITMPEIQKTLELFFLFSLVLCHWANSSDQRDHLCSSAFSYAKNKTSSQCIERSYA